MKKSLIAFIIIFGCHSLSSAQTTATKATTPQVNTIVAEFNGGTVTLPEFEEVYNPIHARFTPLGDRNNEKNRLENLIKSITLRKKIYQIATEKGILSSRDYQSELKQNSEAYLQELLLKNEQKKRIQITDDMIKKYYDTKTDEFSTPELRWIQIIALKFNPKDEKDKPEKRKRIEEALKKAREGANFGSLAKEYSSPEYLKQGVTRGPFRKPPENKIPETLKKIWELPLNGISDVTESDGILSIFHVTKISQKEVEPFDQKVKERIKIKIERAREQGLSDELIREYQKKYNAIIKSDLVRKPNTLPSEIVFKVGDFKLTYSDLIDRLKKIGGGSINQKLLEKTFNNIVIKELFSREALAQNLDKTPEFQKQVDLLSSSLLSRMVKDKLVQESTTFTEADMRDYYRKFRDEFKIPDSYEIQELIYTPAQTTATKDTSLNNIFSQISKIHQEIINTGDFDGAIQKYATSLESKEKKGFRKLSVEDELAWKLYSPQVKEMSVGSVSAPILIQGGFAIVKLLKIIPSYYKPESGESGECKFLSKITGNISIESFDEPWDPVTSPTNRAEIERMKLFLSSLLLMIKELLRSDSFDLVILDEINPCLDMGLIETAEFLRILKSRNPSLEIVLTGRNAPLGIIDIADIVTEMRLLKHPFEKGTKARKGIEF